MSAENPTIEDMETIALNLHREGEHSRSEALYNFVNKYKTLARAAKPFAHPDLCKRLPNNGTDENAPIFVRNNAVITLANCKRIAELLDTVPER